jgi:hypothetical protein
MPSTLFAGGLLARVRERGAPRRPWSSARHTPGLPRLLYAGRYGALCRPKDRRLALHRPARRRAWACSTINLELPLADDDPVTGARLSRRVPSPRATRSSLSSSAGRFCTPHPARSRPSAPSAASLRRSSHQTSASSSLHRATQPLKTRLPQASSGCASRRTLAHRQSRRRLPTTGAFDRCLEGWTNYDLGRSPASTATRPYVTPSRKLHAEPATEFRRLCCSLLTGDPDRPVQLTRCRL